MSYYLEILILLLLSSNFDRNTCVFQESEDCVSRRGDILLWQRIIFRVPISNIPT